MDKSKEFLSVAVESARLAGVYLARNMTRRKTVDLEKAHDLKLSIDRYSEKRIIQHLKKHSHFSILSEEAGTLKGADSRWTWVVDPLDGTINYFHQIPLCCVSIALCRGREPVLGVIYDFTREDLFTAVVGYGAYLNGRRIHVSRVKNKKQAVLATGFPSQTSLLSKDLADFCRHLRAFKKVRLMGTAALSMAYVACGRLDAYREMDIMFWDVAAGMAILKAAGGDYEIAPTSHMHRYHLNAHNSFLGKN